MALRGTKKMNAFEIAQRVENIGGYINAYTGRETNNYSIRFFSEDVLTGLEIVSNILKFNITERLSWREK